MVSHGMSARAYNPPPWNVAAVVRHDLADSARRAGTDRRRDIPVRHGLACRDVLDYREHSGNEVVRLRLAHIDSVLDGLGRAVPQNHVVLELTERAESEGLEQGKRSGILAQCLQRDPILAA